MTERNESKAWSYGDLQGEVLGKHYLLETKLGQGGMAWVYRAKHQMLGGNVAVKILFPQLAENENIRTRFLREAQIQYQLEHPNIVRVLDFIDERGLVGFVSEWCSGGDLVTWHQAQGFRGLASGEIRSLFLPLLDAIHLAHERQVIHRDLKPHNIMLHQRGDLLIPKLTDFGIAKQVEEQGLTSTGMVVGTVHYMSPEQLYESKSVDRRTDIYSLGVILYQLTSGQLPFVGEAPSLYMKILEKPHPVIENIPDVYQAVLDRCLAKRASDRFANCMELRAALDSCLDPPLPILPLGQAMTEAALQQALVGFNSAASSSPVFSVRPPSWNPQAVSVNVQSRPPKFVPSGADVEIDPHAETVIGRHRSVAKSSLWRNLFFLLLCVVTAGGAWWYWEDYASQPVVDAGITQKTGIIQQPQQKVAEEHMVISEEKGVGSSGILLGVDAGESIERKQIVPVLRENPEVPEVDSVAIPERLVLPVRRVVPPKRRITHGKRPNLAVLCGRGRVSACFKLGQREEKKPYSAIRYQKVYAWYRKACEGKVGEACGAVARLLQEGRLGIPNMPLARYYYSVGCSRRHALSCRQAGWLYQKGQGGSLNHGYARSYYRLGCGMNDSIACNLLGIAYSRGVGGAVEHQQALGLYKKSCQLKNKIGCYNVGMMYRKGLGIALNHRVALGYFRTSCQMGSGPACSMVAQTLWFLSGRKACTSINGYLQRACRLRYSSACQMSCASYRRTHRRKTWLDDAP